MRGTETAVILAYRPTDQLSPYLCVSLSLSLSLSLSISIPVSLSLSLSPSLSAVHALHNCYFQTDADPTQTSASPDTASKAILRSAIVWEA